MYVTIKEKETRNESTGIGTRESFKGEKRSEKLYNYIIITNKFNVL